MNRSRAPAFRAAEAFVGAGKHVAIVGCISRTWYDDQSTLVEVFGWLAEEGAKPIAIGGDAFTLTIGAAAAQCEGAVPIDVVSESDAAGVARSIAVTSLCVVMVPRRRTTGARGCLQDAGPVVGEARQSGVPLLALYHDGDADFFPAEDV